jgi:putative transcriptional regulator
MTLFRTILFGILAAVLFPSLAAAAETGPYLAGQLLVAAPKLGDPRFTETVIYMVRHNRDGALGLIVNRPLGSGPMDKFFEGFGLDAEGAEGSIRIHYGGPVAPGTAFVLHSPDYHGPGTTRVPGGLSMSTRLNVLKAIAEGTGPKQSLIVFGYAGWGAGQLEGEMARDDWLTAPAEDALIFSDDPEGVWDKAMAKAGISL